MDSPHLLAEQVVNLLDRQPPVQTKRMFHGLVS